MSAIESLDRTTPGDSGGELSRILALQRDAFVADGFPSAEIRRHRIDRLVALMLDNADALVDALVRDFGSKSMSLMARILCAA